MLIPCKHSGYMAGIRIYPGGKGSTSSAPPPDPRLIQAQIDSMGIQGDAIKQIMSNAADLAPVQKDQLQFGLDTAKEAYGQSQQDRDWMLTRRNMLSGVQDKIAGQANDFNEADRAAQLTSQATEDITQATSNAEGQTARMLASRGISANSGAAVAAATDMNLKKALAIAGASNQARTTAKNEGIALTDRANNTLAGYPAMTSQATGSGAQFGTAGLNLANTGLAGLNSGSGQAAGVAGQMGSNAASMYGAMGNYKTGQDKAANDDGGFMGFLGTIGGAAITHWSDRRLKRNIKRIGDDPRGFGWYEYEYVWGGGRRVGVMAQEVEPIIAHAVTTVAGVKAVDYALL